MGDQGGLGEEMVKTAADRLIVQRPSAVCRQGVPASGKGSSVAGTGCHLQRRDLEASKRIR